jgi:hypothetical protein
MRGGLARFRSREHGNLARRSFYGLEFSTICGAGRGYRRGNKYVQEGKMGRVAGGTS